MLMRVTFLLAYTSRVVLNCLCQTELQQNILSVCSVSNVLLNNHTILLYRSAFEVVNIYSLIAL